MSGLDEGEVLFRDRVPEAAARQLAVVLAHAAECALATVEELQHKSRISKYHLNRHKLIADTLVYHCKDLNVPPTGLLGRKCPRLADELTAPIEHLQLRIQSNPLSSRLASGREGR